MSLRLITFAAAALAPSAAAPALAQRADSAASRWGLGPQHLARALGRFSIFDAEGQNRSVRAGGLSALLSHLWLPSHVQRATFSQEHDLTFASALRSVERAVDAARHSSLAPPPMIAFDQARGRGPAFDFGALLALHERFQPLLPPAA